MINRAQLWLECLTCVSRHAAVFSISRHQRLLPAQEQVWAEQWSGSNSCLMMPVCLETGQRLIREGHFICLKLHVCYFNFSCHHSTDSWVLVKFIHLLLITILHNDLPPPLEWCSKVKNLPQNLACHLNRPDKAATRLLRFSWVYSTFHKIT